jgi:PAS domain S-box-containing protein
MVGMAPHASQMLVERVVAAQGGQGQKHCHRRYRTLPRLSTRPAPFRPILACFSRGQASFPYNRWFGSVQGGPGVRDSEAQYRSIVESLPLLVCRCTPAGVIEFVNEAYASHFGRSRAALVGTSVLDLVPAADREGLRDLLFSVPPDRPSISLDYRGVAADGSERVHRWTTTAVRDDDGRVIAIQAFGEDVTERDRAERAVQVSEQRLRFFIDHAPGALAMFDRDLRYLAVNRRWLVDYSPDGADLVGRLHHDVFPDVPAAWREAHRRALAGEIVRMDRDQFLRSDGTMRWVRWEVLPWYTAAEAIGGLVIFAEDVTSRVESEEAARLARKDTAELIETIDGIVWEADAATFAFTFVSAQAERLLGYPVTAWLDDPGFWAAHIHPADRAASVRYCIECTQAGRDHQFDYRMIAADGREVWLQDRVTVHLVAGRPATLRGVMVDITDRKRAEAAVRESEVRFRTLADSAPMMVWSDDPDRRCDFVNQRWVDFTGRDLAALPRLGWADLVHPDDRAALVAMHAAAFAARQPFEIDHRFRRADGEYRWVSTHGVPRIDPGGAFRGFIGTCVDITDRRRAEETRQRLETQLRQSQKMEAMGTLAGGIAHDFNNLLAAIGGNLELVSMDLGPAHPVQDNLDEMRRAVRRATELVQRILTFSRPETHEQQTIQLAPVVTEAVHLLRPLIPAGVQLTQRVEPGLPDVLANASQVHQVLVNLVTNAWQAMDGGPGRIEVRLGTRLVDEALCETHADLRPGAHVCLAVEDSGHGMTPATVERIFEPFFTTKSPGKGTGLGLSMVHGIARGHGGTVLVDSEVRRGSTFTVLFPVCASVAPDDATPGVPQALRGHGEHILYVDDEAPLVKLVVQFLERLGYRVDGYTSADEALAAFRQQPDAFDAVVTDYNMPGLSGMDVALAVMSLRPSMLVALASGYLRPAEAEHARALGIHATIPKPYTLEELGLAVQRLLHVRHEQP